MNASKQYRVNALKWAFVAFLISVLITLFCYGFNKPLLSGTYSFPIAIWGGNLHYREIPSIPILLLIPLMTVLVFAIRYIYLSWEKLKIKSKFFFKEIKICIMVGVLIAIISSFGLQGGFAATITILLFAIVLTLLGVADYEDGSFLKGMVFIFIAGTAGITTNTLVFTLFFTTLGLLESIAMTIISFLAFLALSFILIGILPCILTLIEVTENAFTSLAFKERPVKDISVTEKEVSDTANSVA